MIETSKPEILDNPSRRKMLVGVASFAAGILSGVDRLLAQGHGKIFTNRLGEQPVEGQWRTTVEDTVKLSSQLEEYKTSLLSEYGILLSFGIEEVLNTSKGLDVKELKELAAQVQAAMEVSNQMAKYVGLPTVKYFDKLHIVSGLVMKTSKGDVNALASAEAHQKRMIVKVFPEQIEMSAIMSSGTGYARPFLKFTEGTFDHEIAHLVLLEVMKDPTEYYKYVYGSNENDWPKNVNILNHEAGATPELLTRYGFVNSYCRVSPDEDIATIAGCLLTTTFTKKQLDNIRIQKKIDFLKLKYEERLGIKKNGPYWDIIQKFSHLYRRGL